MAMESVPKAGYNPNRIPQTVFSPATTTTGTQEWSLASNDSLFSIHIDTNPFSPNRVTPVHRSEDMSNLDQLNQYNTGYSKTDSTDDETKPHGDTEVKKQEITEAETEIREVFMVPRPDTPREIRLSPIMSSGSIPSFKGSIPSFKSASSFTFTIAPCRYSKEPQRWNTPINAKTKIGKPKISRPNSSSVRGSYHKRPKKTGLGGWLSCFFCFSAKN